MQSLSQTVTTQQSAWIETDRDAKYLLDSQTIGQVREFIELRVALLEDRSFREFWEAARRGPPAAHR